MVHDAEVRVRSPVPPSRGLKTSSAVADAVVLATAAAAGGRIRPEEAVRLGIEAALAEGVTVTGAFDDACAAIAGRLVLTDNRTRSILRQQTAVAAGLAGKAVEILVPDLEIRKSRLDQRRFSRARGACRRAFTEAMDGDVLGALTRNGRAIEEVLALDPAPARAALAAGALAAGVSGTGPAVVAVARGGDHAVGLALARYGKVIHTRAGSRPGGVLA